MARPHSSPSKAAPGPFHPRPLLAFPCQPPPCRRCPPGRPDASFPAGFPYPPCTLPTRRHDRLWRPRRPGASRGVTYRDVGAGRVGGCNMAAPSAPRPPRPRKEPQPLVIPRSAAEEQRLRLERLMRNPVRAPAGPWPRAAGLSGERETETATSPGSVRGEGPSPASAFLLPGSVREEGPSPPFLLRGSVREDGPKHPTPHTPRLPPPRFCEGRRTETPSAFLLPGSLRGEGLIPLFSFPGP